MVVNRFCQSISEKHSGLCLRTTATPAIAVALGGGAGVELGGGAVGADLVGELCGACALLVEVALGVGSPASSSAAVPPWRHGDRGSRSVVLVERSPLRHPAEVRSL
jgi:hypothetical protein